MQILPDSTRILQRTRHSVVFDTSRSADIFEDREFSCSADLKDIEDGWEEVVH